MIPPLFLQPPVDKSFSFIAQTQGLQVHRPQKGAKKGGSAGVEEGMGRRMVSGEIREEGTEPPYPGLTSTPIHPTPHVPNPVWLHCAATHEGGANCDGAAWRYQAFLVCVAAGRGQAWQRGHVAVAALFF